MDQVITASQRRSGLIRKLTGMSGLLFCAILLLGIAGVMMQFSASGGHMQPWASPHLIRLILGLLVMITMAIMPIQLYVRLAYFIYAICIGMLVYVEVAGYIGMGAQRWINLGFMHLQPSELTKIAIIIMLARYFHQVNTDDVNHPFMLMTPLLLTALPVLLILKQPNLGTATITAIIAFSMLFMTRIKWHYFAALIMLIMIAAPVGWQFLHDYQKQRVLTFLDPGKDPLGAGYNINQSMIAIGSGGFSGKGFLKGSQAQLDFLPEKQTDFIFTMLAEEFGFIGCMALLLCYMCILIYGIALMLRSRSRFGSLIAAGVTAMLFTHIFVNIAMVMGMLPVVGVPLPLLSYGGTFMLATMMALGLLMNVYVHRDVSLHRNIRAFF